MIALLLGWQTMVPVAELPDPRETHIRVEIIAGLTRPTKAEWAAANVLREALFAGSIDFTGIELLAFSTQAGDPLRITLARDHIRIGFSVPKGNMKLAVRLMDDFVRDAMLPESAVMEAVSELPFVRRGAWAEAWLPWKPSVSKISQAEVKSFYRSIFSPGNVSIAFGGSFMAGEAKRECQARLGSWKSGVSPSRSYRDTSLPERLDSRNVGLVTVSLLGNAVPLVPTIAVISGVPSEGPDPLSTAMLACSMLGQGKGSTLFKVLRREMGLSYRQEAYLAPDPEGLRPSLVFASADSAAGKSDFRVRLQTSIEAWSEADRQRALSLTKSNVDLNLGLGCLYLAADRPITESLEDRTFLQAYWKLKTGRSFDWRQQLSLLGKVPLEDVKQFALKWINEGAVSVIAPAH